MNRSISVIIPTYNRIHLIGYTIENILQQTLVPKEIIVVDDHSTDDTMNWLKEKYGDKLILLTNKGKGPGAARNTGFEYATGNIIQFFDSDDLMSLDKLEIQTNLLGDKKDTFVYGCYALASAPPEEWKLMDAILQYYPLPDFNLLKWVYRGWCSITQACLFPRELIEKVGPWREDIYTHEDRDYWYKIAKVITVPPIHENISCTIYRQHTDQLTLKTERQIQRANDSILVDNEIRNNDLRLDVVSEFLLKARIHSTINYLYKHHKQKLFNNRSKTIFFSLIHRIYSKWNRYFTKNNWQKMHGATTSNEIFLDKINKFK